MNGQRLRVPREVFSEWLLQHPEDEPPDNVAYNGIVTQRVAQQRWRVSLDYKPGETYVATTTQVKKWAIRTTEHPLTTQNPQEQLHVKTPSKRLQHTEHSVSKRPRHDDFYGAPESQEGQQTPHTPHAPAARDNTIDATKHFRRVPAAYQTLRVTLTELYHAVLPRAWLQTELKKYENLTAGTLLDNLIDPEQLDEWGYAHIKEISHWLFNSIRGEMLNKTKFVNWANRIEKAAYPGQLLGVIVDLVGAFKPNALTPLIGSLPPLHWCHEVKQCIPSLSKPCYDAKKNTDMCAICGEKNNPCIDHPFFRLLMCHGCKSEYDSSVWTCDEQGLDDLCRICGCGGVIVTCKHCNYGFCESCLLCFEGDAHMHQLDWECPAFRGSKDSMQRPCRLCRRNWKDHVPQTQLLQEDDEESGSDTDDEGCASLEGAKFYGYDKDQSPGYDDDGGNTEQIEDWACGCREKLVNLEQLTAHGKHGLRVLSLFDGIGGALVSLKCLGVRVEKYFTCEVDQDAMDIVQANHSGDVDIVCLGNVCDLDRAKVKTLGRIDLVIGGSPCNDLTCVKRDRQGLSGDSSIMYFEFVRVLAWVREESDPAHSRNVLFLFENVSSMRAQDKETITRHLEVPPLQINARKLSAARRNRLYWLNFRPEVTIPPALMLCLRVVAAAYTQSVGNTPVDADWQWRSVI